ncbi:MAG TPA: OsmC family protein [Acidobacteriaceae bacterium]|jgi:uncharacterized OsmC-like protein|nr:OsmC family protein [Acidobacteriaceae bacterium]
MAQCTSPGARGHAADPPVEPPFSANAPFLPDIQVAHSVLSFPVRPREPVLEITLQHSGGARFAAEARQHKILLDQPAEDGATDHGMTPAELLLAALGGCVGQFVAQYLKLRGLSTEGLLIRVHAQPAQRPLRLKDFQIEIIAPGLNERQLRTLEKSFPAGLVQNAIALENALRITAVCAHSEDVQP